MTTFKRFLTLFLISTLAISAWGTDVTISSSDSWTGGKSGGGAAISITSGAISINISSGYKDSDPKIRWYSGATMTVTSTGGNITRLVFNTGGSNIAVPSGGAGTWNSSTNTWNGNSATVTLRTSAQVKWSSVIVTYSGSTGTDPTITFNNGSYTIGGSALNLSTLFSSNSSGAVTYTVKNANGTGASISGTSFTATTAGTCTVQAAQAAQGSYNAKTVTATITVSTAPINVTLHYKGTTAVLSNQTNPYTLPTTGTYVADACDAWVFDGWYGSSYAESTSKPTYITQLTSTGSAYAVYKHSEGGGSETFTPSTTTTAGWGNSRGSHSGTIGNYTIATDDGLCSTEIRTYSGSDFTVSATTGKISSITFTPSSGYSISNLSTTKGTLSGNAWTGDETSVTFNASSQVRFDAIVIGNGTTYYSTDAECGPKVQATASPWVTSTQGATVKVEVPVTATNFDKSCTLSASVSGAGFSIVGWGANGNSVTKDVDLTTSLILAYNPSAYNTTADATITFSSNYSGSQTPVYVAGTVHGRSLPEKFVIAIKNGDQWYALPANMSGSNTYAGIAVNVDNTTNPTKVTAGPATALYSLLNVYKTSGSGDRYADYGTRVRFLGNEKCLWSNAANSGTGISNNAVPNSATSDNYEWTLVTTDGITYAINTNVQQKIDEGRELRYRAGESRFGMYTDGNSSFRFLPVDCDSRATVSNVESTYNTVTLTWTGKSGTDYNVYIDEGGVTKKTETNVTSPVTITGLSSETNYTWIISPGAKDAECALSGAFTTNVAPIHVSLSCDGTVYNLGPQDKPYTLPTTGAYVADACTEWKFVGWTNGTYSKNSSAPTLITQMTADGTAYAVYKKTEAGSASGSLTMTGARTTGGGYNTTYSETEYTTESDAITIESNNIINNTSYIQLKAGTGNRIYNTTAMPGNITQITVTATTNDAYVYVGSSAVGSGSSALTPTSGSTSGTAVYTIPAGNTYFAIGATGSYVVVSSIEVEYSSSTSYYATSSECCNEVAPPTVVVEPLDVSATISWDNQSGATNGYHVTCSNGTDQDVAAGVTSLVINGLSALTTYTYTVTAKGTTCNRAVEGSFETASCANVPTNVNVNPGTHSATISWMQTTGTTATVVIYDDDLGTNIVKSVANQTSPCVITGLNDNTDYWLQVFANGTCPHPLKPFTTNTPTVELVEWFPDSIRIVLDADENTASVLIEDKKENTTVSTSYADSIFISKYFEADSENKLIAIYNGTSDTIPLSNYCLKRSVRDASGIPPTPHELTMELGSYGRIKPGYIAPNEEIILIRYAQQNDKSAEPCASTQEGYSNWYVFENSSSEGNFLNFSGPMSIGLYSKTAHKFIDVIGASTNAAGTGNLCQIDASNSQSCASATKSFNDMAGFYSLHGDDQQTEEVETNYGLSTNRCLLIRKNTVKSGINAVESNVYSTWQECSSDIAESFTTLSYEWAGIQVGPGTSSGETHSNTCIGMGYVGGFDYNAYYAHFDSLTTVDELSGNRREDGTYNIPIPQLDTLSCTMLRVKVYEGTEEKASTEYKVPIMIDATDATTKDDKYFHSYARENNSEDVCRECDVVILRDAVLTKAPASDPKDIAEVRNLTIYPGGTLVVPNGGAYDFTVKNIQFRVEGENVPHAKLRGTLYSNDQQVVVSRRIDNSDAFFFSLPYDCNLSDVRWSNGEPAMLGEGWKLQEYDAAARAAEGSIAGAPGHWRDITGPTIQAKKGYQIMVNSKYLKELIFPMAIGTTSVSDAEDLKINNTDKVTIAKNEGSTTINNWNWNFIAEPYLCAMTPMEGDNIRAGWLKYTEGEPGEEGVWSYEDGGNVYFTVFNPATRTYDQKKYNELSQLDPFLAYFVQGKAAGEFEFTQSSRILSAPRRMPADEELEPDASIFVGITLSGNGQSDETHLRLRPDFTNEYQLGYDLQKFTTYYTERPQIYMKSPKYQLAYQAVSDSVAKSTWLPMGVYCYLPGTFTFLLNRENLSDEVEAVYLYDATTGTTTNLLYDTYSITTSSQLYTNKRFSLNVWLNRKAPQITTGFDGLEAPDRVVRKILINGHVYIQRGGAIYDMTGKPMLNL